MIRKFKPPINVNDTAIHAIDPEAHKASVVFYLPPKSTHPLSMTPEDQEKLKIELAQRFRLVIRYLFKEGFIEGSAEPTISIWTAISGVTVGEIPN